MSPYILSWRPNFGRSYNRVLLYYQAILAISRCVQGTSVRELESPNTDRNTLARKRVLHITDSSGFHSVPCCAFPDNSHADAAYLQVPRLLRGLNLDVPAISIIEMLVRGSQLWSTWSLAAPHEKGHGTVFHIHSNVLGDWHWSDNQEIEGSGSWCSTCELASGLDRFWRPTRTLPDRAWLPLVLCMQHYERTTSWRAQSSGENLLTSSNGSMNRL
jgi:hypothetical protein